MNMLTKKQKKINIIENTNNTSTKDTNSPMIIPNIIENNKTMKSLRRKRLHSRKNKSDGEVLYVFYAKVKFEVNKKEATNRNTNKSYNYYLLKIFIQNKNDEWKYCTSIYRGSRKDEIYQIVMIGRLNCYGIVNL